MTHTEALTILVKYFNEQATDNIRVKMLKEWMTKNVKDSEIKSFTEMVIAKFKWLPKIAELDELTKVNPEIAAEKAWQSLVHKSSSDNIMIHDPFAYQVVAGYGSWYAFCQHRDDSPEWCRKEFVRRYIMFMQAGEIVESKTLSGAYRCLYGPEFKGVRTIEIGIPTGPAITHNKDNKQQVLDMARNLIKTAEE